MHRLPFADRLLTRLGRPIITPGLDEDVIVKAERIVYARTRTPFATRIGHLLGLLDAPTPDPTSEDRIYLTRRPPVDRRATNEHEVRAVMARHGFRTLDTSAMSVEEQIETFAQARYVVALHGAGVANIIFRAGAPLSVLELHGHTFGGPGDMARICSELGYPHASLAGESEPGRPEHAHFHIDPIALEAAVKTMVNDAARPIADAKAA